MIRSIIELDIIDIQYDFTKKTLGVYAFQHAKSIGAVEPVTRAQLIEMRNDLNDIIWGMNTMDTTAPNEETP